MDIEIRPIAEDEFAAYGHALEAAFGEHFTEQENERERQVFEFDRSLAAFEGKRIVGTTGAYSLVLKVPGASVPMPGVTAVGVLPSHRRRGILTALMRRQLDDFHERGDFVAGLWASEGAIYGRFGFGSAVFGASLAIDRQWTSFARTKDSEGSVELVNKEEALRAMPSVYERVRPGRPGMLDRSDQWWSHLFEDDERWREGASAFFFALRRPPEGGVDGYAVYRVKRSWDGRGSRGELMVRELLAETPEAYAALWAYCFGVDLVLTVSAENRPADEPLLLALAHPRRLGLQLKDTLWLRLVDVPMALASREYEEGVLTMRVNDAFCPWNEASYRLEGGRGGSECKRTASEPDLSVHSADLAAAFLGGVRFSALAQAGRVIEETPGAIRRADAMFGTDVMPWCSHVF